MSYSLTQPAGLAQPRSAVWPIVLPNALVRLAFCFALFAIPFARIYIPGTGERLGITRMAQLLIIAAIISQPRICIRKIPVALLFIVAYCVLRIGMGFFLTPGLAEFWWNTTFDLMQTLFMFLFFFNVLQNEGMGIRGLWAYVGGVTFCSILHIAGLGTEQLASGAESRISLFGENANVVGTTYAIALIASLGMLIHGRQSFKSSALLLPCVALMGTGLAMTGSRGGALMMIMGLVMLLVPIKPQRLKPKTILLFVIIATIFAGVLYKVPVIAMRAQSSLASSLDDEPRKRMFPVLLDIYLRSPIYGHGPDHYREELTWRAMPHLFAKGKSSTSAHNVVLLTLVETGVIGFALFAIGIALILKAAWRARWGKLQLLPLALAVPPVVISIVSGHPHYSSAFWVAMAYALSDPQ